MRLLLPSAVLLAFSIPASASAFAKVAPIKRPFFAGSLHAPKPLAELSLGRAALVQSALLVAPSAPESFKVQVRALDVVTPETRRALAPYDVPGLEQAFLPDEETGASRWNKADAERAYARGSRWAATEAEMLLRQIVYADDSPVELRAFARAIDGVRASQLGVLEPRVAARLELTAMNARRLARERARRRRR